jgi:hypothetical protein
MFIKIAATLFMLTVGVTSLIYGLVNNQPVIAIGSSLLLVLIFGFIKAFLSK